jgi:hypothetical protein
MSRGLGVRQRQFLLALAALEAEKGKRGAFYVSTVVSSVWKNTTVKAEYDEWLRLRTIAPQEQESRRAAALDVRAAEMTALAADGDEKAKKWLDNSRQLHILGIAIRCSQRPKQWRLQYRPETTGNGWDSLESMLNPSRIIAELRKRGLVVTRRGIVRLTDAGRDKCGNLFPTLSGEARELRSDI